MMKKFDELPIRKGKKPIMDNKKIYEKLRPSARKYKEVLSANKEVFINFEETPASNIEPLRYEMDGTEILSFVYTGYSQSRITITPALPFIVYMYDGKSLFGSESNCSKDVINFLCKNKQTRTISFNAPQNIVNKEQKPHVYIRNKMSARELVISEKASLQFVENPNTGKIFFTCGSKKGYVSPAALEHMEKGKLDDFCYAEVSMDGKTYIPSLMLANKLTEKVVRSFDVETAENDDLPF